MGFKLDNIHKMYLLNFLANLQFFGAVAVPFFLDWAQIDYTRIFLLEAWFMFWIFVLEVPTGIVADKYGRKLSVALGVLCSAVSFLIFGSVNNYYVFYVAEFICGAGVAFVSGAATALLYDTLVQQKKQNEARHYLSRYTAAETLALVLAFPLGSMIAGSSILPYPQTLPLTMILASAMIFLGFLVASTLEEPKRRKPLKKSFIQSGIEGFTCLLRHRTLRAFALNSALISATTFFIFWFYQPLAGEAGIDITYYGVIGAGFNLFGSFLLLKLNHIEKAVGIKRVLFYSALLPGLFLVLLAVFKGMVIVLLGVFVITGFKLLRGPVLSDFMNQHIESRNRATVLSGVSMLERVTVFVLYPIVGLLADMSLDYALIFLGVATLILAFLTKVEEEHLK